MSHKTISHLGPIGLSPATNVLTPISSNAKSQAAISPAIQVGSTWAGAGLNIDLDNIMGGNSNKGGPAPTMNQLASNSPQHHAKPMGKIEIHFPYLKVFLFFVFRMRFIQLLGSHRKKINYHLRTVAVDPGNDHKFLKIGKNWKDSEFIF